jgi:hypothetical protein
VPPVTTSIAAIAMVLAVSGAMPLAENRTIRGEVVAPGCAADAAPDAPPESPAARTMRCARRGDPMAILTSDGQYLVEGDYTANNNAKLLDFVGKPVEAKGNVTESEGRKAINIAAMIVVTSSEAAPQTAEHVAPPR